MHVMAPMIVIELTSMYLPQLRLESMKVIFVNETKTIIATVYLIYLSILGLTVRRKKLWYALLHLILIIYAIRKNSRSSSSLFSFSSSSKLSSIIIPANNLL